jgi:hypothetical protein
MPQDESCEHPPVQYVVHVYSRKYCFHSNSRDKEA